MTKLLNLEALVFIKDDNDKQKWKVEGNWFAFNDTEMSLEGEINDMHNIQFTLKEENESDKIFEGTIDDGKVHMKGKWKYKDSDEEQDFEFRLIDKIKGRMKLDPRFWPKIAERIELDMMTMNISNITSDD